jgi:hypothetical protein
VIEFVEFQKIARLSREIVVTEKIDGSNGVIHIGEFMNGEHPFLVGSRSRWITPEDDNFGFAKWAHAHRDELCDGLGVGTHYGEWWGCGIQRRYGQDTKRFSLFNVARWNEKRPACCDVVPTLYTGPMDTAAIDAALSVIARDGSHAAPGFMDPEGVVIWHSAARVLFKKTLKKDDEWKGKTP